MNSNAGTLAETLEEKARWDPWKNSEDYSTKAILARKAARDLARQRMQRILNSVSSFSYNFCIHRSSLKFGLFLLSSIFMKISAYMVIDIEIRFKPIRIGLNVVLCV